PQLRGGGGGAARGERDGVQARRARPRGRRPSVPRDVQVVERRLPAPRDLPPRGMSFDFTAEQLHAIESRSGSLFLHANAGSGKTSVLVERFVRAVREDEVGVDRILAITFTEKAAAELKQRIRKRFLDLGERERAREAEGAWICTIHGFCSRLLRAHPLAAGIDPEYRVLDQPETDRVGIDAFRRALDAFLESDPRE